MQFRYIVAAIIVLVLSFKTSFVKGQNDFTVSGTVTDMASGKSLPGATVVIKSTTKGAVTDNNGYFRISGITSVKPGIQVTFIGYKPYETTLDFSGKKSLNLKVRLEEMTTNLDQVDVVGPTEGQVKAMVRQKEATTIKNIVSAEQIRQFPDVNAAEVVQHPWNHDSARSGRRPLCTASRNRPSVYQLQHQWRTDQLTRKRGKVHRAGCNRCRSD